MRKTAHIHTEAGVAYCWNQYPLTRPVPEYFRPVHYRWFHVPTGKTGVNTVHLWDDKALPRLLAHWNAPGEWEYSEV